MAPYRSRRLKSRRAPTMHKLNYYLKLWLASVRYSVTRTLMFRADFLLWSTVELFWMGINILLVSVIYAHTDSIAGWSKYEMLLLLGTSMLVQRLLIGFFWANIHELGDNIRTGKFDFFLAQPGNLMFMASTRKLDLDSLANSVVAIALVAYSARELGLSPSLLDLATYAFLVGCGLVIHYSFMLTMVSLSFWITNAQGLEGSYFTLFSFSRIPREAFRGVTQLVFVWTLPVVIVSNAPAQTILYGFNPQLCLWLAGAAAFWFALTVIVFHCGLKRYSSASS
ncbi:ABC transporter permease [Cephaloticoccus capnophilus]|nr:ABC-2 family transporter protein [Cephaloticoccus capnophilus]